jgi:teichuronic acid biosynthesis glycosyltransferase TuaG
MEMTAAVTSTESTKLTKSTNEVLVSIITPAYNALRFLAETESSVMAQTYQKWEWIIIDDGSTDGTYEYLLALVQKDKRVQVFQTAGRFGPAKARTLGFRNVSGEYICFLDADDLWLPEKLKLQLDFMTSKNTSFSYHSYRRISEDGAITGHLLQAHPKVSYNKLLWFHNIGCLTVMLHRQLIVNEEMESAAHEDLAFWLKILKKNNIEAYGLEVDLARYRVVKKSRSANKKLAALNMWKLFREHLKLDIFHSSYCFIRYGITSLLKYGKF